MKILTKINRKKSLRILFQILGAFAQFPFYWLGLLVPRKNELWVFGNVYGYRDNARYLYEYVDKNHKEIRTIWISHSRISKNGHNSYWRYSFKGIVLQYLAGVSFVSTGMGDLAKFTLAGAKIVQLWHGIPIKRILLDSPESLPLGSKPGIIRDLSLKIFQ